MVERTHANTPAKSKKNKTNKNLQEIRDRHMRKRIRHPECSSCRFWFFFLIFLIWPAYLHGFSQPCLDFLVFWFPQVVCFRNSSSTRRGPFCFRTVQWNIVGLIPLHWIALVKGGHWDGHLTQCRSCVGMIPPTRARTEWNNQLLQLRSENVLWLLLCKIIGIYCVLQAFLEKGRLWGGHEPK